MAAWVCAALVTTIQTPQSGSGIQDLLALDHKRNVFEGGLFRHDEPVNRRKRSANAALNGVTALQTPFPTGELGRQLAMVAKLIAARSNLACNDRSFLRCRRLRYAWRPARRPIWAVE